ncbi:MAG: MGMT family protein [Dermatophilaceae bacterium]
MACTAGRRAEHADGHGGREDVALEVPVAAWEVLDVVDAIPPGRVRTYGDVAALVGCGPRYAGWVMRRYGHLVPWWRVVNAAGDLPAGLRERAGAHWRDEGTALGTDGRVDLSRGRLPTQDERSSPFRSS